MRQDARDDRKLVLAFINVNGLKPITDRTGQEAGERALIDTAALLANHAVATSEEGFALRLRDALASRRNRIELSRRPAG